MRLVSVLLPPCRRRRQEAQIPRPWRLGPSLLTSAPTGWKRPLPCCFILLLAGLALVLLAPGVRGQDFETDSLALSRRFYRGGEETLRAFKPLSEATRNSVVKFNVNGETVALGAVMDASGLVLTKASELKPGKLTCWLATEKEVPAEVLATDEEEDVALVRVQSKGLQPLQWTTAEVVEGQWAVTPGVAATPHAVGIISALPRRIRPRRAVIGITFDIHTPQPKVGEVWEGFSAAKGGLQPGDMIVAVNGTGVTNREAVVEMLREYRAGESVTLRIEREEKQFTADLKLMAPDSAPFGRGFLLEESPTRLAGEVSQRAQGFERALEHDTVLQPWLCGGPLVNLAGKGIGLNIARASRVTTYALPASLVMRLFENLKLKAAAHPDGRG